MPTPKSGRRRKRSSGSSQNSSGVKSTKKSRTIDTSKTMDDTDFPELPASQPVQSKTKPKRQTAHAQIMDSLSDPSSELFKTLISTLSSHIKVAIDTHLAPHTAQIRHLTSTIREKDIVIENLEKRVDELEQYGRRNAVTISGIPENKDDNTDQIMLDITRDKLGIKLEAHEIGRSHRIPGGPPPRQDSAFRPRPIVVKFISYNVRKRVYDARKNLKNHTPGGHIYINEHLTRTRSGLLYSCRSLVKGQKAKQAWSFDGRIFMKDFNDKIHLITCENDKETFTQSRSFPQGPTPHSAPNQPEQHRRIEDRLLSHSMYNTPVKPPTSHSTPIAIQPPNSPRDITSSAPNITSTANMSPK